jgi:hypothetical protein
MPGSPPNRWPDKLMFTMLFSAVVLGLPDDGRNRVTKIVVHRHWLTISVSAIEYDRISFPFSIPFNVAGESAWSSDSCRDMNAGAIAIWSQSRAAGKEITKITKRNNGRADKTRNSSCALFIMLWSGGQ